MEENKKTNDFFNICLRALNEGIKIFDDDFVNKVMEKVTVNKDDNTYYKKETWKNGNLIDKVEKRWKDGKLVFPEETKTNESTNNKEPFFTKRVNIIIITPINIIIN